MPNNMSQTLGRPWKFNHEIEEFFVEDETRITLRKSDVTKRTETTELDDSLLHFFGGPHLLNRPSVSMTWIGFPLCPFKEVERAEAPKGPEPMDDESGDDDADASKPNPPVLQSKVSELYVIRLLISFKVI